MNTLTVDTYVIENRKIESVNIDLGDMKVLADGEEPKAGHRIFRILNSTDGDKRLVWNSRIFEEIKAAKKMFNKLLKSSLRPFKVDPSGKKTPEIMTSKGRVW